MGTRIVLCRRRRCPARLWTHKCWSRARKDQFQQYMEIYYVLSTSGKRCTGCGPVRGGRDKVFLAHRTCDETICASLTAHVTSDVTSVHQSQHETICAPITTHVTRQYVQSPHIWRNNMYINHNMKRDNVCINHNTFDEKICVQSSYMWRGNFCTNQNTRDEIILHQWHFT